MLEAFLAQQMNENREFMTCAKLKLIYEQSIP